MRFITDNAAVFATVVALIAVVAVFGVITRRIRRVPPNQALIIVGRGAGRSAANATDGQKVVIGGRVFVWPVLQEAFVISLEQRQLALTIDGVDQNFIKVSVKASVLFKVSGTEDGVRRAGQRFMNQQADLESPLQQALEGALRPIIGAMTVEKLISDRDSLQSQVVQSIKSDLAEQGFQVDLINLSDIATPGSDYLVNLGRAEAARARQVAETKEAEAELTSQTAKLETAERVAERQRDLDLKKAAIKAQTQKADAEAEAAGQLARAAQDKLVAVEQRDALAEQAKVTQQQLDIDVRKPAEAEAYAKVQEATAARDAANAETEAKAYERKQIAEANRLAAEADAAATRATGEAEAAAIKAKGEAEGAAIKAQADALSHQGDAVLVQQLIAVLPKVVAAAAEPISNIDKLTVVSTDGASALTKTVTRNATEGAGILSSLVPGLDLSGLFASFLGTKTGTGDGASVEKV